MYLAAVALAGSSDEERARPWLRIREALLKATLPCGQWKIFAAEAALFPVVAQTPGGVPAEGGFRGDWRLDEAKTAKAEEWLRKVYGEEMAAREIKVTGILAQDIGEYFFLPVEVSR